MATSGDTGGAVLCGFSDDIGNAPADYADTSQNFAHKKHILICI